MAKPKIAFFSLTCCEGCQLQIANMGEALLDLFSAVDLVEFREIISEKWSGTYDIVMVEGSVTSQQAIEQVKKIREKAKILIAFGSCATIGGVNGMKNNFVLDEIESYVYGQDAKYFSSIPTLAVHQVVKVDYFVHNCPIYIPEFVKVLKSAIAGVIHTPPDYAVCVECKLNENVCMYDRGISCLGPITRGGCNSWCINNNNICYGCRGLVSNPNINGTQDIIRKYKIPLDMIMNKMNMYNKCREKEQYGKEQKR